MIITLILATTALALAVIVIRRMRRLTAAALSAYDWLNSAPLDYDNDDENFINGWTGHSEIVDDLAKALGINADRELWNEFPF